MKCPKCNKEIKKVNILKECWQKGTVENGKIVDYGTIEEILEITIIEHNEGECWANVTDLVDVE